MPGKLFIQVRNFTIGCLRKKEGNFPSRKLRKQTQIMIHKEMCPVLLSYAENLAT